uniref:Putative alpha-L-fucosidase n=1 Tax=Xenopsylla cheopis TaxID=163159 RepID=A0A6M2E334_XENCH
MEKLKEILKLIIQVLLLISINYQVSSASESKKYEPTWESLDSRPSPTWYDDAKIGIFLHWGVYAVPSFGTEWFWQNWQGTHNSAYEDFMKKNYPPGFTYQDFGRDFTAELYDPNHWAELFQASGAKYVILTSKHHEGYALWPSKYSFSWNSQDVGAHKDLIGDLATAVRNKTSLRFGLYHSLFEWFNRLYLEDKDSGFKNRNFPEMKVLPEMYELINIYKPSILWSDGEWEADDSYWGSREFLAWLYNESPVKDEVIVNDRWGSTTLCKHGGFYTCVDRYNPGVLQEHKWENAMTLDYGSWGYRRNAKLSDYMPTKVLLKTLMETISCGGNLLVNVGPTKEGTIDAIFEERLRELGAWLNINGKAVYETKPWLYQNDTLTPGVWFTEPKVENSNTVFTFFHDWPQADELEVAVLHEHLGDNGTVKMIGNQEELKWSKTDKSVKITLPHKTPVKDAWVLEVTLK